MLVVSGGIGKKIEAYPSMRPAVEMAIKYEDPLNPRLEGDRFEWVYVRGNARDKTKSELSEDPEVAIAKGLPIDYRRYAALIVTQLETIMGPLFGGKAGEVERVFMLGKHMLYSVDPFSHDAPETSTFMCMPAGTKVNHITRYTVRAATHKCFVCNMSIDPEKDPGVPVTGVRGVGAPLPDALKLLRVHNECAEVRCEVCGTPCTSTGLAVVCDSCASNATRLEAHKKLPPWERKRGKHTLNSVARNTLETYGTATKELVGCIKRCMACVGEGNEERIDMCAAKSCGWWRRGNYSVRLVKHMHTKMENNGVYDYLLSKRIQVASPGAIKQSL